MRKETKEKMKKLGQVGKETVKFAWPTIGGAIVAPFQPQVGAGMIMFNIPYAIGYPRYRIYRESKRKHK